MLNELYSKVKDLVRNANMIGIPLPMVKDPKTGIGSVSLTLVFISSITVILGLVGKWSGKLGIVDINNALEFFYASSFLYFGRAWKTSTTPVVKDDVSSTAPEVDNPDEVSSTTTTPVVK
jgi:hypothetical protein